MNTNCLKIFEVTYYVRWTKTCIRYIYLQIHGRNSPLLCHFPRYANRHDPRCWRYRRPFSRIIRTITNSLTRLYCMKYPSQDAKTVQDAMIHRNRVGGCNSLIQLYHTRYNCTIHSTLDWSMGQFAFTRDLVADTRTAGFDL